MSQDQTKPDADLHQQVEAMRATLAENRAHIEALRGRADDSEARADKADLRADDSDARSDRADLRADASEAQSGRDRLRIDALEERADVDRAMISELQADGLINESHVSELKAALRSSRTIGAALGIVIAKRHVSEPDAFKILVRASQNTNQKLRLVADEIVTTGEVEHLPQA